MSAALRLLLLAGVLAGGAVAGSASGAIAPDCLPGVPIPGCEGSGPTDPGGEPQPPPRPPQGPAGPCAVKRSAGTGTLVGIVAEQAYGTDSHYRGCTLSALADAGVRIVRQPLRWAEVERKRGAYDFSWWDRYVAALAEHRLRVLPILFEPPAFRSARGETRGIYPPRRFPEMAAFAARVARRYGPGGSFWRSHPRLPAIPIRSWQVWNEPNLVFYWPPKPDARAYTRLLATVGRAIKRVDPRAEIVTAGLPQSDIRGAVPQRRYLRAMYAAGAAPHFDTLAIHPYTERHADLVDQVTAVRGEMRRQRDRAGIWITEIGWASGGPDKKLTPGRAGQARRVDQVLDLVRARRRALGIRGVVYYMWQDAPPYPGFRDFWGLHTGLLDIQGRAKPAMRAFRRNARGLRNAR